MIKSLSYKIVSAGLVGIIAVTSTGCAAKTSQIVINEIFATESDTASNLDSPGVWYHSSDSVWVIATAKAGNKLHVFDGHSGNLIKTVGATGVLPGQFARPNGIAIHENIAFVVERDNHRVQVLSLPDFKPLGYFGDTVLVKPYGISVVAKNDNSISSATKFSLFITDDYELPSSTDNLNQAFQRRIKVFDVSVTVDTAIGVVNSVFGDTSRAGRLWVVESIFADPEHDNLLIADEDSLDIKVYGVGGNFKGITFGKNVFKYEPEGISLFSCGKSGYWITTDQDRKDNRFHIFDRETFQHVGTFKGAVTSNTDGIAFIQRPVGPYRDGVLYALHDDGAVTAFSWTDIAKALKLQTACN